MSTKYGARYTNNSTIAGDEVFTFSPWIPSLEHHFSGGLEYLLADLEPPKPKPKNKSVEKKVKRAGWLPQFYEK